MGVWVGQYVDPDRRGTWSAMLGSHDPTKAALLMFRHCQSGDVVWFQAQFKNHPDQLNTEGYYQKRWVFYHLPTQHVLQQIRLTINLSSFHQMRAMARKMEKELMETHEMVSRSVHSQKQSEVMVCKLQKVMIELQRNNEHLRNQYHDLRSQHDQRGIAVEDAHTVKYLS